VAPLHLAPRHGRRRRLLLPLTLSSCPARATTSGGAAIAVDLRQARASLRHHLVARRPRPAAGGPLPQLEAGQLVLRLRLRLLLVQQLELAGHAAWAQRQGLLRVGRAGGGSPVHGEIPGRCRASATTARATVPFHS